MAMKKFLGWFFLTIGMVLLISPFISGLTGYFVLNSAPIFPIGTSSEIIYAVVGLLLATIGYYLIRPKKQNVLS